VGGSYAEIAASEARAVAGNPPDRPFVLVSQPTLFDDTRAPAGRHIAWGYCHVPHGYSGDATQAIEDQMERFAPGFKDTIIGRHSQTAVELDRYNPNYVGGDIGGGMLNLSQLVARPLLGRNPYRIGERTYLCSASTAPGAGVHGMCGYHAVDAASRELGLAPPADLA
jgi:phytoene dehydrogenase-like protein